MKHVDSDVIIDKFVHFKGVQNGLCMIKDIISIGTVPTGNLMCENNSDSDEFFINLFILKE